MTQPETKQFNFTLEQIAGLVTKQDELNTYIHPEWKTQDFDWNTAIIDECQEIAGHLGWKWWKKGYKEGLTEANKKQVQLEVIDILHFVLSLDVQEGANIINMADWINSPVPEGRNPEVTNDWLRCDAANGVVTLRIWAELAHSVGLTEQEILETYIQKYVLNKFRQDHGYKDGSYVKVWKVNEPGLHDSEDGVKCFWEDNEVLAAEVAHMVIEGQDTTDELALYERLELRYNSRLNK